MGLYMSDRSHVSADTLSTGRMTHAATNSQLAEVKNK